MASEPKTAVAVMKLIVAEVASAPDNPVGAVAGEPPSIQIGAPVPPRVAVPVAVTFTSGAVVSAQFWSIWSMESKEQLVHVPFRLAGLPEAPVTVSDVVVLLLELLLPQPFTTTSAARRSNIPIPAPVRFIIHSPFRNEFAVVYGGLSWML
jgi:hypothetical protein